MLNQDKIQISIDNPSKEKIDLGELKEFNIEMVDGNDLAIQIEGNKSDLIKFLTSSKYAVEYSKMIDIYPSLATNYSNIQYAFIQCDDESIDVLKWLDLDEDAFTEKLYNDERIIIKDNYSNKIIEIDVNYDADLQYKIFNSDVIIDNYEKIDDFDKYSVLKIGLIDSVMDESVGWNTPARDGIEQILNVSSKIKRDYKEILKKFVGVEIVNEIEKKCKMDEYNSISAFKDIIKTALTNHTNNNIPSSAFEDMIFVEEDVLDWTFSKLDKPLKNIIQDMNYVTSQDIDLDEAIQLVNEKSNSINIQESNKIKIKG